MKAKRKYNIILGSEKKKNCQPRILYPVKTSFRMKGKPTFSDDGKLRKICHQTYPKKNG